MNAQELLLIVGVLTPLITLAGSAVAYVRLEAQKNKQSRYNRFWEVMKQSGAADGNIAAKMAAFFELRQYPEYTEVIIRLCDGAETSGASGALLKQEMMSTAQYLRGRIKK